MRFRLPFLERLLHQAVDESALAGARAELAMAEAALVAARATYLPLQDADYPAKLKLQQSVLDRALHRYHAARQVVRILESPTVEQDFGGAGHCERSAAIHRCRGLRHRLDCHACGCGSQ